VFFPSYPIPPTPRKCVIDTGKTKFTIGNDQPLALIAGPCVIESEELNMKVAKTLAEVSQRLGIPVIYKSSYEKDNRGSEKNWRGPMAEDGLKILKKIRETYGLPVLSDVHRESDMKLASEYLDVIQIPAYLSQQTGLLLEAGKTGRVINVKKGQFLAPENMSGAVSKLRSVGNHNVLLTERGACFGYNRLVSDIRCIPIMQSLGAPVVYDSTHIVRIYGISSADPAGGEPEFVPYLTKAAVAAGADCLFLETHPEPPKAKCDAASQLRLDLLEPLVKKSIEISKVVGRA